MQRIFEDLTDLPVFLKNTQEAENKIDGVFTLVVKSFRRQEHVNTSMFDLSPVAKTEWVEYPEVEFQVTGSGILLMSDVSNSPQHNEWKYHKQDELERANKLYQENHDRLRRSFVSVIYDQWRKKVRPPAPSG